MSRRIHVFGASGSGTTTLGKALGNKLNMPHLEADDFYWKPTPIPFSEKHPKEVRIQRIEEHINGHQNWVLSGGSLYTWGEPLIPKFTLVIFLHLPAEIRLARLRKRELERYGSLLESDPVIQKKSCDFLKWAANYDTAEDSSRTLGIHKNWIAQLHCPVLELDSQETVESLVEKVLTVAL